MRKFAPEGKFGVMAPSTVTQNFATADATHAARTANAPAAATYAAPTAPPSALTVTDGAGTNDGTIGAITDNASTIAAVQELAASIGSIITSITSTQTQLAALAADVANIRTELTALRVDHLDSASLLNSVVDAAQARKILG